MKGIKSSANHKEKVLLNMFMENTRKNILDSGSAYERKWQQNQKENVKKFLKGPSVYFSPSYNHDIYNDGTYYMSVNTFKYLMNILQEDNLCFEFNENFNVMKDWESDKFYGCSREAEIWLNEHEFEKENSFNTYNVDSTLDVVLQGSMLRQNGNIDSYVLLQVHGRGDVRDGYTNSKLFLVTSLYARDEYIDSTPMIYGHIENKKTGEYFNVSTEYNGYSLTIDGQRDNIVKRNVKENSYFFVNGDKLFLDI